MKRVFTMIAALRRAVFGADAGADGKCRVELHQIDLGDWPAIDAELEAALLGNRHHRNIDSRKG